MTKVFGDGRGGQVSAQLAEPFVVWVLDQNGSRQTVLSYFLPTPGSARLEVFTLTGQRVAVLQQGPQEAGYHQLRWNGHDDAGRPVASGLYLYRLVTSEDVLTRKLVLLR